FNWTISDANGNTVTVTNPGSQSGTLGTPISGLQLHATDSATNQTLTFTATGLPPGLSISASGLITGTPTAGGSFAVTATASDSTGASGSVSFNWTVSGGATGFPSGYHRLVVADNSLCLDVYGNGSNTGQQLDQW